MPTSALCAAGRCGHRPLRASKYRKAFRISYVKYSTGANVATHIIFRALRKPDSTVARRAFLDRRCNEKTHNETKCFFARKRYRTRLAPLFCILFSGKTEKSMPPEAQLRCRRNYGTSGESGKEFRASGAILCPPGIKRLAHPPDALICVLRAQWRRHPS